MDNDKQNSAIGVGGVFSFEQVRDGKVVDSWDQHNLVTNEGLDYILGTALYSTTDLAYGFLSLYRTAITVVAGDTQAAFPARAGEVATTTHVTNTSRPAWTLAGVASHGLTNAASPAAFTFAADTTIKGAMLTQASTSTSAFAATAGVLVAASNFTADRVMLAGDVLNVSYAINIAAA